MFRVAQRSANVIIKSPSEGITVVYSEYSLEEVNVGSKAEILVGVMVLWFPELFGNLLPFDEHSLRYSRVIDSGFDDQDSLI